MAIIKCKMCGGNIQLYEDSAVGICEYCGSMTHESMILSGASGQFQVSEKTLHLMGTFIENIKTGNISEAIILPEM